MKLNRIKNIFLFTILIVFFSYWYIQTYLKINAEVTSSWKFETKADCAIVLTGGAGRIREGFDMLSRKQVKKLIISGVHSNSQLKDIMPMWAYYSNLKESDVVLERRSNTTFGNAQQSLPIFEALNCRDLALVTSRTHMYRAFRTFLQTFPSSISIYRVATHTPSVDLGRFEVWSEVLKTMFYDLWAF